MSKRIARNARSYENEDRQFAEAAKAVEIAGFRNVSRRKSGSAKLIDAESGDGKKVAFWVKLGWSEAPYAAIQFGLFPGVDGGTLPDEDFSQAVFKRTMSVKARGATHALLFHPGTMALALPIEEVAKAYDEELRRFPKVARNTKSPTLWFFDPRPNANPQIAAIVRRRAIPLEVLAKRSDVTARDSESRSRMAEVELRIQQAAFRNRVGERFGWCCVVTGSTIRQTLDAAHLPGRNWRTSNLATDGILVRADIHRLLDSGLATVVNGIFKVGDDARQEYGQFDGLRLTLAT